MTRSVSTPVTNDRGDSDRDHEDREPRGDVGAAFAAAIAERDVDGKCDRPQRRADHVEPYRDQCDTHEPHPT